MNSFKEHSYHHLRTNLKKKRLQPSVSATQPTLPSLYIRTYTHLLHSVQRNSLPIPLLRKHKEKGKELQIMSVSYLGVGGGVGFEGLKRGATFYRFYRRRSFWGWCDRLSKSARTLFFFYVARNLLDHSIWGTCTGPYDVTNSLKLRYH